MVFDHVLPEVGDFIFLAFLRGELYCYPASMLFALGIEERRREESYPEVLPQSPNPLR
jgi:hypothetical protein